LTLFKSQFVFGQSESESGLSAVKVMLQNTASLGGAGAYASSESVTCNLSGLIPSVPNCMNSIFGLLQMEASLEGLDNARKVAIQILDEGNPNLQVDLKAEGFCVAPLVDFCTQDEIDKEVATLYEAMKSGTADSYTLAINSLQADIEARLSVFELKGYVVDKIAKKVTPPLGAAQSFSGGTTVAAALFQKAEDKFKNSIAQKETLIDAIEPVTAASLLSAAKSFFTSTVTYSADPEPPVLVHTEFSSKTGSSSTKAPSFLASLSDTQKTTAVVAPQSEEVFGTVSSRYNKLQNSGDFIQP